MALVRCLTEMGMGVDVHGRDYTRAARRAVSDAIRHSSIGFFRLIDRSIDEMFVEVNIGIPDPDAVDKEAVAAELPYGTVTVKTTAGGLEIPDESGKDAMVIANAAVLVLFDDRKDQKG
ncbi:MAG: Lin0512 family protein [Pseudomonadota bacterium]